MLTFLSLKGKMNYNEKYYSCPICSRLNVKEIIDSHWGV